MYMVKTYPIFLVTFLIFLSCAFDVANIKYNPAKISICSENCPSFKVKKDQLLNNLPCGYNRTLRKDSVWVFVGEIEAGDVYKSTNQCFTIECSNVFEAYLVMNGNEINGFYLPVEDGYFALDKPINIYKMENGGKKWKNSYFIY